MIKCKFCGVEDLTWEETESKPRWILLESDGQEHSCKQSDICKQSDALKKQKEENQSLINDYRDRNGYI
jgi:hypothetical protein